MDRWSMSDVIVSSYNNLDDIDSNETENRTL